MRGISAAQSVSPQTARVVSYLSRYIARHPEKLRDLETAHLRQTKRPLSPPLRCRHFKLQSEPSGGTLLAYLIFLHAEKALLSTKVPGKLFEFAHPELLRR